MPFWKRSGNPRRAPPPSLPALVQTESMLANGRPAAPLDKAAAVAADVVVLGDSDIALVFALAVRLLRAGTSVCVVEMPTPSTPPTPQLLASTSLFEVLGVGKEVLDACSRPAEVVVEHSTEDDTHSTRTTLHNIVDLFRLLDTSRLRRHLLTMLRATGTGAFHHVRHHRVLLDESRIDDETGCELAVVLCDNDKRRGKLTGRLLVDASRGTLAMARHLRKVPKKLPDNIANAATAWSTFVRRHDSTSDQSQLEGSTSYTYYRSALQVHLCAFPHGWLTITPIDDDTVTLHIVVQHKPMFLFTTAEELFRRTVDEHVTVGRLIAPFCHKEGTEWHGEHKILRWTPAFSGPAWLGTTSVYAGDFLGLSTQHEHALVCAAASATVAILNGAPIRTSSSLNSSVAEPTTTASTSINDNAGNFSKAMPPEHTAFVSLVSALTGQYLHDTQLCLLSTAHPTLFERYVSFKLAVSLPFLARSLAATLHVKESSPPSHILQHAVRQHTLTMHYLNRQWQSTMQRLTHTLLVAETSSSSTSTDCDSTRPSASAIQAASDIITAFLHSQLHSVPYAYAPSRFLRTHNDFFEEPNLPIHIHIHPPSPPATPRSPYAPPALPPVRHRKVSLLMPNETLRFRMSANDLSTSSRRKKDKALLSKRKSAPPSTTKLSPLPTKSTPVLPPIVKDKL